MDGVVDVEFAIAMGKLGGLGVLNLDGISTRYDKPREVVSQIAGATPEEATRLVQEMYRPPVQEDRIDARTRAPAEPDLRRLKKAEIEVERRIVTLKKRVTN